MSVGGAAAGATEAPSRMDPERLAVFIVSNEPWGPQHFIKHRFALELADQGAEVFFLDPFAPWSPRNLWDRAMTVTKVQPGIRVVQCRHPVPSRLGATSSMRINDRVLGRRLRGLAGERTPLLWQFDPFRFAWNFLGSGSSKIYHVCDPYVGLPGDRPSAANADLIPCSSEQFTRHYRHQYGDRAIHVPHSISESETRADPGEVAALVARHGRYLLLSGSLNERVDIGLLERVAESFPEVSLVLAGPIRVSDSRAAAVRDLVSRESVSHVGVVPASEVPAYVAGAQVCLTAYHFYERSQLGPTTSLLKVVNYLAQGKPVVTSSPLEYDELEGRAVYSCSTADAYMDAVDGLLAGRIHPDREAIDTFMEPRTYANAVRAILDALGRRRAGEPSRSADAVLA